MNIGRCVLIWVLKWDWSHEIILLFLWYYFCLTCNMVSMRPNYLIKSMVERKVCIYVVHSVISQTSFFVHISFFILMLHILFIIYSMRLKRDFVLHRIGAPHFTFKIFLRIQNFLAFYLGWKLNFQWSNISNIFTIFLNVVELS